MITEVNCLSYAYHRLGLRKEEVFINALREDRWRHDFDDVGLDDAEAVGFIGLFYDEPALVHLAVFDEDDRDIVRQRPCRGGREEPRFLLSVESEHRDKEKIYLKVKPEARSR